MINSACRQLASTTQTGGVTYAKYLTIHNVALAALAAGGVIGAYLCWSHYFTSETSSQSLIKDPEGSNRQENTKTRIDKKKDSHVKEKENDPDAGSDASDGELKKLLDTEAGVSDRELVEDLDADSDASDGELVEDLDADSDASDGELVEDLDADSDASDGELVEDLGADSDASDGELVEDLDADSDASDGELVESQSEGSDEEVEVGDSSERKDFVALLRTSVENNETLEEFNRLLASEHFDPSMLAPTEHSDRGVIGDYIRAHEESESFNLGVVEVLYHAWKGAEYAESRKEFINWLLSSLLAVVKYECFGKYKAALDVVLEIERGWGMTDSLNEEIEKAVKDIFQKKNTADFVKAILHKNEEEVARLLNIDGPHQNPFTMYNALNLGDPISYLLYQEGAMNLPILDLLLDQVEKRDLPAVIDAYMPRPGVVLSAPSMVKLYIGYRCFQRLKELDQEYQIPKQYETWFNPHLQPTDQLKGVLARNVMPIMVGDQSNFDTQSNLLTIISRLKLREGVLNLAGCGFEKYIYMFLTKGSPKLLDDMIKGIDIDLADCLLVACDHNDCNMAINLLRCHEQSVNNNSKIVEQLVAVAIQKAHSPTKFERVLTILKEAISLGAVVPEDALNSKQESLNKIFRRREKIKQDLKDALGL